MAGRYFIYRIWQYRVIGIYYKKLLARKITGKAWVIYESMNKGKESIENSSPLYWTYKPIAIQKMNIMEIGSKYRR